MNKQTLLMALAIIICQATLAQKPKDTFDHEKFAKKVSTYITLDVTAMSPKEDDLKYISTVTGKSLDEIKTQNETSKTTLKADADYLNKNRVGRIIDKVELTNVQDSPIKKADIVLSCHYQNRNFTLTLTNCIQTNTTWVLGDHITPAGAGFEGLMASKKENAAKADNSFLGKLAADVRAQQKQDSIARVAQTKEQRMRDSISQATAAKNNIKVPAPYKAIAFGMVNGDASTQYIHFDQIDKPLKGYYITKQGEKVDAVIAYEAPEKLTLGNWNLQICKEVNDKKEALYYEGVPNFLKSIKKDDLKAFYVGDQLWVESAPGHWDILVNEGAIRKLFRIIKISNNGTNSYTAAQLLQKLNESPVNPSSLVLNFKNSMSAMVKENQDMATKIQAKQSGYTFMSIDKLIVDYNFWYDQQFPGKVGYLFLRVKQKFRIST